MFLNTSLRGGAADEAISPLVRRLPRYARSNVNCRFFVGVTLLVLSEITIYAHQTMFSEKIGLGTFLDFYYFCNLYERLFDLKCDIV
jgi:hypothetical protein